MAMSSSMRRRSGLKTTEACSWDIEGTSRDEGDPSCSEPHPTPSSSHRLHQLYSTPPQALPRSGFVLCAGHVQQPGGESPLCNLMEVKHERSARAEPRGTV